jgi:hypothetical protein
MASVDASCTTECARARPQPCRPSETGLSRGVLTRRPLAGFGERRRHGYHLGRGHVDADQNAGRSIPEKNVSFSTSSSRRQTGNSPPVAGRRGRWAAPTSGIWTMLVLPQSRRRFRLRAPPQAKRNKRHDESPLTLRENGGNTKESEVTDG